MLRFGFALLAFLFWSQTSLAVLQDSRTPDWASLDRQAEELYVKGDLKEAIRVAKLAVAAASDPKQSGRSLNRLGFFEYTSGNLKDAESFLRQALELRRKQVGIDTADYAESANDLALFGRDTGRLSEAKGLAEEAIAIRKRIFGDRHSVVAETLNTLGGIHGGLGEYDLAISRFEEARAIHEAQPGPRDFSEEYGTLCVNLAGTYHRVGKYAQAEALFEKGLEVLREKPGVNHPAYAVSLVGFAYLQADLGHYALAEKVYAESGRLMLEQLGEQHQNYPAFLNNRAALYYALGNLTAAESDYRKSLELKRKIFNPDAPTIGASLRNLARLVYGRDTAEGEKLFREAADLYGRNPKAPPFEYATVLMSLGEAERRRGDLAAANATLERASDLVAKALSTKHPLYAAVLRNRAQVHRTAREYAEAERLLQEAITIVRDTHGGNHPDLGAYLQTLASVYDDAGDFNAAEPLYRRSLEISDRALSEMLTVGSESNKASVLANLEDPVPALLSFQQRAGERLPAARALAFEAVAQRKVRVLEAVHDWGQSLRESSDSGIRESLNQRQALLQCQASLTIGLGYRDMRSPVVGTCALQGTELEGRYDRLLSDLRIAWTDALGRRAIEAVDVLQQRINGLEAGLSRQLPQLDWAIRPARLEDIRSRLKPDEMLLEFVGHVRPADRASDPEQQHYGAFLLGRTLELQWVDLGPSRPIDRAVQDLVAAANDWSVSLAGNERRAAATAEETAKDALRILSEKLSPIIKSLAQTQQIQKLRIAPDGMLNLLPFAALSDDRGRPLIERFIISYVSSGRDVGAPASATDNAGPPIIALSPGIRSKGLKPASVTATAFRADRLERLEGAELEARDLRRRMPKAVLWGEGEATERRLKQLHRPSLLHIVGHGIVRGNEDCRSAPASPGCQLAAIDPAARVMSLSAIVLEEAYGRGGDSPQDGLLTALELQTLDLQGSEMLVLSQCRMADGVPTSGEGVFGMRRAAAIAGVRTFVAPLWKVADSTQQALMNGFYRELSAGKDRADALRAAQLQLLRNRVTGSFLQWAPVILSGDTVPLPATLFVQR